MPANVIIIRQRRMNAASLLDVNQRLYAGQIGSLVMSTGGACLALQKIFDFNNHFMFLLI
jgi:hypothetical protein